MGAKLSRINQPRGVAKPSPKSVTIWVNNEPEQTLSVFTNPPKFYLVPTISLERKRFAEHSEMYGPPTKNATSKVIPIRDQFQYWEQVICQSIDVRLAPSSVAGSSTHQGLTLFRMKTEPLIYQLRLKMPDNPTTRLILLELYDLDMQTLTEEDFVHWCSNSGMPHTMSMYKTFAQDATIYAMKRHMTALERRFGVQFTLGDSIPMYELTIDDTVDQLFPPDQMVRELVIYGKRKNEMIAAVQYLAAILNQLRRNQLLLPNNHLFSLSTNMNLYQWICPQFADARDDLLLQLRKRAKRNL